MSLTSQQVSLKVHFSTAWGEEVLVAGSYWKSWTEFQPMRWNVGSWWEIVFHVPLPLHIDRCGDEEQEQRAGATALEYKYVVRGAGGELRWEGCANRVLRVTKAQSARDTLLVVDTWDHPDSTRKTWGMSDADKAAAARRETEEDARAREAGLRFFAETIAKTREESAKKRSELEQSLAVSEQRRIETLEKERKKKISRRGRSSSPSPAASPVPAHSPTSSPPPLELKTSVSIPRK